MHEEVFSYRNPTPRASVREGVLSGVTLALQSNISVKGWPAQAGSLALENFQAIEDAVVVERLQAAGAHIAGYTKVAELAFGLDGDTSAAAVASSSCDAALVTDTLGEARVAAARSGLVGFKPTAGVVSRYGLIGLIPSMEAPGIIARGIGTVTRVMQTVCGPDPRDFSLRGEFPEFGVPAEGNGAVMDAIVVPESLALLDAAEKSAFEAALSKTGAKIRKAPVADYQLFRDVHQAVGSAEASSSAGKYDSVRYGHRAQKGDNWNEMYLESRKECFGPLVKAFLFQGAYFQFKNYDAFENACRVRRQLVDAMDEIMGESGVLVLPTTRKAAASGQAGDVAGLYDQFSLTLAANVAGLPSISIPGLVEVDGEDIGLQLIGRRMDDASLLGYAAGLVSKQ